MKKQILRWLSTVLVASFVIFSKAQAAVFDCTDPEGCGAGGGLTQLGTYIPGTGIIPSDNLVAVILGWVKFALALVGTIAFVAFIWAGFLYITAFGNEENAEKGKKILIWTAIGIIIIIVSYALTSALINASVDGV